MFVSLDFPQARVNFQQDSSDPSLSLAGIFPTGDTMRILLQSAVGRFNGIFQASPQEVKNTEPMACQSFFKALVKAVDRGLIEQAQFFVDDA